MLINDQRSKKTVEFWRLAKEDCFFYEDQLFMKVSISDSSNVYNFSSHSLQNISNSDLKVDYVPTELVIHGPNWNCSEKTEGEK
jgi:hypothetical protein